MARQARLRVADQLFWIRARSVPGRTLFRDDRDRRDFLTALLAAGRSRRWRLWSWVLLRDEYHLLVRGDTSAVSAAARDLNASYSRSRAEGRLFAGRFSAIIVDCEVYLAPLAAWMFQRPVEEGLANDPARWPWSAYPDLATMRKPLVPLDRRAMLAELGGDREGLNRLRLAVYQASAEIWNPADHITGQLVLGSREFLEMLRRSGERPTPLPAVEDVIEGVGREWRTDQQSIRSGRGGEPRSAVATLLRESGLTLAATGAALGIGESAASRLISSVQRNGFSEAGTQRLKRLRRRLLASRNAAEPERLAEREGDE